MPADGARKARKMLFFRASQDEYCAAGDTLLQVNALGRWAKPCMGSFCVGSLKVRSASGVDDFVIASMRVSIDDPDEGEARWGWTLCLFGGQIRRDDLPRTVEIR